MKVNDTYKLLSVRGSQLVCLENGEAISHQIKVVSTMEGGTTKATVLAHFNHEEFGLQYDGEKLTHGDFYLDYVSDIIVFPSTPPQRMQFTVFVDIGDTKEPPIIPERLCGFQKQHRAMFNNLKPTNENKR